MQAAIDSVHTNIDKIHLTDEQGSRWEKLLELIHTLDHMQRLHERSEEEEYRAIVVRDAPELVGQRQIFVEGLGVMRIAGPSWPAQRLNCMPNLIPAIVIFGTRS